MDIAGPVVEPPCDIPGTENTYPPVVDSVAMLPTDVGALGQKVIDWGVGEAVAPADADGDRVLVVQSVVNVMEP